MKNNQENRGITLIALVITIIVLLILAGTSITVITGENGIINKSSTSRNATKIATIQETLDLYKSTNNLNASTGETSEKNELIKDVADRLKSNNIITEEEKNKLANDGFIKVDEEIFNFTNGLIPEERIVTSSEDKIFFKEALKKGDILYEKENINSFSIVGISNSREGNFSNSTVNGKSGILEVIGNMQDANFEYKLTEFMKGDEIFYVKAVADGVEYIQELKVIQGDAVVYQENFAKIEYIGNWKEVEDPNASNKKIMTCEVSGKEVPSIELIGLQGSAYDYNFKMETGITILVSVKIQDGKTEYGSIIAIDVLPEQVGMFTNFEASPRLSAFKLNKDYIYDTSLILTTAYAPTGKFSLDSVVVYK